MIVKPESMTFADKKIRLGFRTMKNRRKNES